ncbi:MAG: protein kinase [Deltaproteobacteria bacterium]|nr:protein kinase [Deltaproteobacteria bacterium]
MLRPRPDPSLAPPHGYPKIAVTTESPLLFGKYQLLERVARGGMAEVFKAKSYGVEGFEKTVVIKRILPELAVNQQFVDMFLNEARLSVTLSHANIVQVFDLGREEDTYFIAMEYVVGMDFAQALRACRKAEKPVPLELCLYIACEVARALDYAHRRRDASGRPLGVVHRDISPQNVLLSYEGEVKVTDFGIAKARSTIEEQGTVKGKFAYMAPEQAAGAPVDGRADIYALGVTLYEALAGANPFSGLTPFETAFRVKAGQWKPLKEAAPSVPEELCNIIHGAMAMEPDARPPAAARLYEDLSAFLYTTGNRVGPHDLSEWLQGLRASAPVASVDSRRLREALATDVRSPRTGVPPTPSTGRVPTHPTGGSHPHIERRDVTFLSVAISMSHTFMGDPASLEAMAQLSSRWGAQVHDRNETEIVLVFGLLRPDGRDTEAALRCALTLQAFARRTLAGADVGLGIHPARVQVDAAGALLKDDLTSVAAAAAQELAWRAKDRLVTSAAASSAVEGLFESEPLEDVGVGGARVITGERAERSARRKVVGRKDAFRRFGDRLAAAAQGTLQYLSLEGEAGIGKTRFLEEINYRLHRAGHDVRWYTASCLPQDREVQLSGLVAALRAVLGIDESDPESVARSKARRLRELGLSPEEMLAVGAALGVVKATLSGVTESSRPLRSGVVRCLGALCQEKLTVLVWDAAENLDDATVTLLGEVLQDLSKARLMVVFAARPGRSWPWTEAPTAGLETLEPLSDDEARLMVGLRLGVVSVLPAELLDDLWAKSRGIPLYVDEYLKALRECGAVEVRDAQALYHREVAVVGVPRTVRGVVASRLASVPSAARRLLQVAAVFGMRFALGPLGSVAEMTDAAVEGAVSALIERGVLVVAAGGEYGFAHEIVREVMYESLSLDSRRSLHGGVASVLEQLHDGRLDDHAERLAFHHREAGNRPQAVSWLERAARRLLGEHNPDGAAVAWSRALDILQAGARPEPAQILRLYLSLGEAALLGTRNAWAIERLRAGIAFAEELGDAEALLGLRLLLGRLLTARGRGAEAIHHLEKALEMVDPTGDRDARRGLVSALGAAHVAAGDYGHAVQHLEEAVRLAAAAGLDGERVQALLSLARCQAAAGDHELAQATVDRVAAVAEAEPTVAVRLQVEQTRAEVALSQRDHATATAAAGRAAELAREAGDPEVVCEASLLLGEACLRAGEYRRAFAALRECQALAEERASRRPAVLSGAYLAFLDATQFGRADGRERLEKLLAGMGTDAAVLDQLLVRLLLGRALAALAEPDGARRHFREALALAHQAGHRRYIEDCEAALRDTVGETKRPPGP